MRIPAGSSILLVWLALAAEAPAQLHSGDIRLSVPVVGGPIVTAGGEWVGDYAGRVFDEGIMPATPPFVTGSPGFDSTTGTFPARSLIRFDFVKELLYWNGATLAPPATTLSIDYQDVRFASITGGDTAGAPGFIITSVPSNGSFHEHLDYALPSDAAAGLYGVVLTLGPGGATPAFTTSDSFLVTFARGSFSGYVEGLQAMVDAAFAAAAGIVIDVPAGTQTQAQAGYPTIGSASSVTKTGIGTLVFDAANAYAGPTAIAAGTLLVTHAAALAATTATVGPGGTLALPAVPRVVAQVAGLAVDHASTGGRVDLGAGELVIAAGGISAADLRADIVAGRNGGAWNGPAGITSSAAAATTGRAVGYVVEGDGSVRVSFAAPGDVDLSGQVNVFDLVSINGSGTYGTGGTSVWSQGDFTYDGATNVFDLVAVNTAGVYGQGGYFPAPSATAAVAPVPEPGVAGVAAAALAAASLARPLRRRVWGRDRTAGAGSSCK